MISLLSLSIALAAPPPEDLLIDAFSCQVAGAMVGPEDYAVLDQGGARRLLVSANRYRPGDQGESEGIFSLDLDTGASERLRVEGRDACSFHPHGVALTGPEDARELYVVVHFRESDASNLSCALKDDGGDPLLDGVERYRVTADGLVFVERLQDPLIVEPNDLVVTPTGEIFMSNNRDFSTLGTLAGALLGWKPSQVLGYTPGEGWAVIARRFFYSNGVLLDDRGELMVASYGGKLTRLTRGADGWERAEVMRLHGALDNLMVGDDGRLWVAGHPSPVAFTKHAKDAANVGPSEVYALTRADQGWQVAESWIDTSGAVSASSTASMLGSRLVFAQVFQPGLVVCDPLKR